LAASGRKTTLLLDEIHHFNRTQQDALLPDVERGIITLIGITTENPYFYVNAALISRSILFEFKPHSDASLERIIERALSDKERGLGAHRVSLHPEAGKHLIEHANGDARRLLNALEIGVLSTRPGENGVIEFDLKVAEESLQKRSLQYDKSSDAHYDHVSAFIKSMRGSDPDAAMYWMTKMLAAGEDPLFIARRIVICASEDVGNADPHALLMAVGALKAFEFIGLPEGKIPLAQAVTYVATAPKSNAAYVALHKAEEEVATSKPREVPNHLKDSAKDGKGKRGHGAGYKYPHDYPGHFIEQEYWPGTRNMYEPSDQGYEAKIGERLLNWRKKKTTAAAPEAPERHTA
ncbi:MAG: replication-associated recombination protein A, partial [Endomicrobiales bacterium]